MDAALEKMCERQVTHLVEEALLNCHSVEIMREILKSSPELPKELRHQDRRDLDDCVFELIGVTDPKQREQLLNALYQETTNYYRYQRTQDIQAMENRSGAKPHRLGPQDLAESIWHALPPDQTSPPITEWIKALALPTETVQIPEGKPHALGASDMFHPNTVIFKGDKDTNQVDYANPDQATLAADLAAFGVRGTVEIPKSPSDCKRCLNDLRAHLAAAHDRFTEAAAKRTGTQSLQEKTATLLMLWFIHGHNP